MCRDCEEEPDVPESGDVSTGDRRGNGRAAAVAALRGIPAAAPNRRRRLWEIDCSLHCSILGTCLTLGDLRRIAVRLHLAFPADVSDYEVHGCFVRWAARPGPVAKQLQRLLERRHAGSIRRFGQTATPAELLDLWGHRLKAGEVPGPYWAVLTHPATTKALESRIFGDVHMLSHLLGTANHADVRRLRALEEERDELAGSLAATRRRLAESEADARRLMHSHAAEVATLTGRLLAAQVAEQRARTLSSAPAPDRKGAAYAERREIDRQREIDRLLAIVSRQEERLNAQQAECEALEALLCSALAGDADSAEAEAVGGSIPVDLGGQRIVYIGGRDRVIPHIRALVERANGAFLHHDGGIEESGPRLEAILAQGDAVFCPIDCVSHNACRRAKELCRQCAKTFVPLRSASLAAIADGLRTLACQTATARPPDAAGNQA